MNTVPVIVAVAIIAVAAFDFTSGFHDESNMIATLVASRAMPPTQAMSLVGVFTFLGRLLAGTAVADTMWSARRSWVSALPSVPTLCTG